MDAEELRHRLSRLDREELRMQLLRAAGQMQWLEDLIAVRDWSASELARRDAEQAERERPIDEEWLASIGWEFRGVFWYYSLPNKRQLVLSQTFSESDVLIKNVASPQFVGLGKMQNRGQLIDLLAALKGGAK